MAVSLACSAEIACSGLFLSNRDSVTVGRHSFFGGVDYWRLTAWLNDGWDFDVGWSSANFLAGFHSDFGLLSMGASLQGISLSSGWATWTPEGGEDSGLPLVDSRWETSLLLKNAWVGARLGDHRLRAFLGNVRSNPVNLDDDYYLRDSANVWMFGGEYSLSAAGVLGATLGYTYVNGEVTLQGIRSQEGNRKRFLYAPMTAAAHLVDVGLDLGSVDIRALAAMVEGHLDNDGRRFYETLAANRVLQNSLVQVLSFGFFQKNYRYNADLDASAIALGGAYRKRFLLKGSSADLSTSPSSGVWLEASASADFFYVDAALDGRRIEETTKLLGSSSSSSAFGWDVDFMGALLGVGLKYCAGVFGVTVSARQLLPLYVDLRRNQASADVNVPGEGVESPSQDSGLSDDSSLVNQLGNGLFISAAFTVSL